MRIDRHIVPVQRTGVFQEVARHPVILIRRGDILHQLTPIAAMDLDAALARGTDKGDRETRVVCHGERHRFAVAGMAFDADLFRVHGLVGLEIVQRAAGAPGPGTQCAPVVHACAAALY